MSVASDSPQDLDILKTASAEAKPRRRMSTTQRLLLFATAWLICLMPFLFWWSTWFGRPLSDRQLNQYLEDNKHPRHIHHPLVQLGDRIARPTNTHLATPMNPGYPQL